MRILDVTAEVDDGKRTKRPVWGLTTLAVHRIWFDDWPDNKIATPVEIARRFIDDPQIAKVTGGENAYTFLIPEDGVWWQCLPLSDTGRHARRWNRQAVGIGVVGDFRKRPPLPEQRASLVGGLAELEAALGARIRGHDELEGGSSNPNKECPGRYLNMDRLRADVADVARSRAIQGLLRSGLVVDW